MSTLSPKTFIVEHLDPELEAWSALEYQAIAHECTADGARFLLSSVPAALEVPQQLRNQPDMRIETRGVEDIFASSKERVCLLDPRASQELRPSDAEAFDVFCFGGILGT